jgi:hypothetical protein
MRDYKPIGRPLPSSLRWWCSALVQHVGPVGATQALGVCRATLLACLSDQPVSAQTERKVHAARERQIVELPSESASAND